MSTEAQDRQSQQTEDPEVKLYMHRISYYGDVSYRLLERHILTIGFNAQDPGLMKKILEYARDDRETYGEFDRIMKDELGHTSRNRWYLWYFARMKEDDTVIIPQSGGRYRIARVKTPARIIQDLPDDKRPASNWNDQRALKMDEKKGLVYADEDKDEAIDLGYFIELKDLRPAFSENKMGFERWKLHADLQSAMKFRGTTRELTTRQSHLDNAWDPQWKSLKEKLFGGKNEDFLKNLNELTPDEFEDLIQKFLEAIGATEVVINPKNQKKVDAEGFSDTDVDAEFEHLQLKVHVQAKRHKIDSLSPSCGVVQIKPYSGFYKSGNNAQRFEDGLRHVAWVITSAKKFTPDTEKKAQKYDVRLINGEEFAEMLLKVSNSWLK